MGFEKYEITLSILRHTVYLLLFSLYCGSVQSGGLVHMEKTADKWGRNNKGEEWHEKWWEHYGAGGQAEKWAHKWCSIDPNAPLDAGHAHVWHER